MNAADSMDPSVVDGSLDSIEDPEKNKDTESADDQGDLESALMMSDEEFLEKGGEAAFEMPVPSADDKTDSSDNAAGDDSGEQKDDSNNTDTSGQDDDDSHSDSGDTQDTHDDDDSKSSDGESDNKDASDNGNESPDTKDKSDNKSENQDTGKVDYKQEYQRILAPFKANGKKIQVDNIDDAITLMQKGVGFHAKMRLLAPRLKIIKMLEKNELLDEGKLNHLIDLSKKNPDAIAKLLKDSDINPLDIDPKKSSDYKPTEYQVSDQEFALDEAIDSIRDSDTFDKTLTVLTKEWDTQSKAIVVENPELIPIIDAHMQNGIFDKVTSVVDQQRALGKLEGVPYIDAYKSVAEALVKQGILRNTGDSGDADPNSDTGSTPAGKKDEKRKAAKDKRKAAAPSRSTKRHTPPDTENVLNMSDEEFMKKYS